MKKIINTIIFALSLSFLACDNPIDNNLGLDNAETLSVVYTVQAVDDSIKRVLSIPMTLDTVFSVYANYGGITYPDKDLKVKFRIAPELVSVYNGANATTYPMMLDNSFSIDNYEVVISKGKLQSAPLNINIDATKFDGIGTYLLPIHIESVTPDVKINDDLRTAFLLINGFYQSNPFSMIDRSTWSIAGFSTDENESNATYLLNGRAVSMLDGADDSFWGTQWRSAKPGPPHWIAIDMGKEEEIHGLKIRGRNAGVATPNVPRDRGNPRLFYIEVSDDNIEWENVGSFAVQNLIENTVYLNHKKKARYIKITITATQADFYGTHIAELYAF